MEDNRPSNCRERLINEGKPYPRSNCESCGEKLSIVCPHPYPSQFGYVPGKLPSIGDLIASSGKPTLPGTITYIKEKQMHHVLKTDPAMFRATRDGKKNFEIRKDDRAFQAGDTVELKYRDDTPPHQPGYPAAFAPNDNREPLKRRITFVLRGGQYGLEAGYVGLALEPLE